MRYLDEKKSKGAHLYRTWVGVIHRLSVNRKYLTDKFWQVQKGCLHQDRQILRKKEEMYSQFKNTEAGFVPVMWDAHTIVYTVAIFGRLLDDRNPTPPPPITLNSCWYTHAALKSGLVYFSLRGTAEHLGWIFLSCCLTRWRTMLNPSGKPECIICITVRVSEHLHAHYRLTVIGIENWLEDMVPGTVPYAYIENE